MLGAVFGVVYCCFMWSHSLTFARGVAGARVSIKQRTSVLGAMTTVIKFSRTTRSTESQVRCCSYSSRLLLESHDIRDPYPDDMSQTQLTVEGGEGVRMIKFG